MFDIRLKAVYMFLKNIKWDITSKCFLNCSFCINASARSCLSKKSDTTYEEKITIIDQLGKNKVEHIQLLGGEPLYTPRFFDLLAYMAFNNLSVGINTNGVMLSKGNIRKIMELNCVDDILVSLDGLKDMHNKIRGADIYDKVMDNLSALIIKRNEKEAKMKIGVNTVLTKSNTDDIFKLLYELDKIGVDYWNGLDLIDFDENTGKYKVIFTLPEILGILKILGYIQKEIKLKIVPSFTTPMIVAYSNKINNSELTIPTHFCNAGLSFAYLDWKGRIYPCDRVVPNITNTDIYEKIKQKELYLQQTPLNACISSDLFKEFSFLYADEDIIPYICYGCKFYKKECNPYPQILRYNDLNNCCIHCAELKRNIVSEFVSRFDSKYSNAVFYIPEYITYYKNKNSKYVFDVQNDEIYQVDEIELQAILSSLYNKHDKTQKEIFYDVLLSYELKTDIFNLDLSTAFSQFKKSFNDLLQNKIILQKPSEIRGK